MLLPGTSRLWLVLAAMSIAPSILADCPCPASASSRTPILATTVLVVCGHQDEVRGDAIVGSELEIFSCERPTPLLAFDSLQTAILRTCGASLYVVEVAQWPFGKDWQWIEVPLYEWDLHAADVQPERQVLRLPPPAVTAGQIRAFLAGYKQWLADNPETRSYESAEENVARLFASAIAGDPEAIALLLNMPDAAGLDGAVAETYSAARQVYDAHRQTRPRLKKR
jgi:hypothetical protein